MKCLRSLAGVLAVVAIALHRVNLAFDGLDNAFYELLPHMPAEIFAAIGSVLTRVGTCEARPAVGVLRSAGLVQPGLDCFDGGSEAPYPVAVATVKGGSILSARLLINMAHRCGLCVGYGFRPSGSWPPPFETLPTYDSESLMAIAFVRGWHEYALAQAGGRADRVRCSLTVRDPFSRVVSMFLYFQSAGEYALRNVSAALEAMPTVDERVTWMWDEIGHATMEQTHAYLVEAKALGCELVRFEALSAGFDAAARHMLRAWGVKEAAHDELVAFSKGLDMSAKTEQQLKADHHHTASKFPKGYKVEVQSAFRRLDRAMQVLNHQRADLGYVVY